MNGFPKTFYFGAATSSHQVEGGNKNDWTEWEKENAERLVKEAAKKQWSDYLLNVKPSPLSSDNYISGRACDHYNRFREDFDIAKSLGHNAHRFSIEWSRIEPEEGKFDEKEIEHYREIIRALRERGIEPFVTLWHFTLPLWVKNQGGWENKKTIADFTKYAEKIIESLGRDVKFWIIINEPTVYAGYGYIVGLFPPQVKNFYRGYRVLKNIMQAYGDVYDLIHVESRDAMVGNAYNLHYHTPYRKWFFPDWLAMKALSYIRDFYPLDYAKGRQDFIGLNYYYRDCVKSTLMGGRFGVIDIKNPDKNVSDMGWDIFPEGLYYVLRSLKKYNLPIFITENGIADARDEKRTKFIGDHLSRMAKAIQEKIDVRGYFYWSLLDNFEWDKGFWPRFGLVEIDYKTLERKIRPSALEYKKIIEMSRLPV